MGEKPFEREVLDRLIIMETKLDTITTQCPQCQAKLGSQEVTLATVVSSTRSAHHRIDGVVDGIYKTAGIISAIVGTIVGFIFTLVNFILHKGG